MYVCFFFFFKQKTAYEMRISDWSSDVCSSDLDWSLPRHSTDAAGRGQPRRHRWPRLARNGAGTNQSAAKKMDSWVSPTCPKATSTSRLATTHSENNLHQGKSVGVRASATDHSRSEEHTSKLQSLMRTSYAVFCLKKNK